VNGWLDSGHGKDLRDGWLFGYWLRAVIIKGV